jgi:hypothetical protein
MDSSVTADRLVYLAEMVCNETASRAELEELDAAIVANKDARQFFFDYCRMHVFLGMELDAEWATKKACEEIERSSAAISIEDRVTAANSPSPAVPATIADILFPTSFRSTIAFFSSGVPFAYLVATVITALGVLAAAFTYVSRPEQQLVVRSLQKAEQRPLPQKEQLVVGRITGLADCIWRDPKAAIAQNSNVSFGTEIALMSGLMEITYDTGAKVILQGPVMYQVESKNGGYMSTGKLTGKVENPNAKGFAVRTPTAVVTDLGTEFGVEVNADGITHAQVFVGTVRVETSGGQKAGNRLARTLTAGHCATVGNSQSISLSVNKEKFEQGVKRFLRVMPTPPSHTDTYRKLVLSMNPVVYYRMDEWPTTDKKHCYALVDSASGGHHGVLHADEAFGKPACRGKFDGALDMHGSMGSDYAFVESYPKANNGRISVSAWVQAVKLDPWAMIVGNWCAAPSGEAVGGQFSFGVNQFCELATVIRQRDGSVAYTCERGLPLPRSQWQHVAFVADGAILHLYRNGMEVGASPYHGIARSPMPECLSVGCQMDLAGKNPRPESALEWNGLLDEIAIFNHAISAEQVRQLHTGQLADEKGREKP